MNENNLVYILGANEEIIDTVEPIYLKQYFIIIKEKNIKEKIIIAKGGKKLEDIFFEYKKLDQLFW